MTMRVTVMASAVQKIHLSCIEIQKESTFALGTGHFEAVYYTAYKQLSTICPCKALDHHPLRVVHSVTFLKVLLCKLKM